MSIEQEIRNEIDNIKQLKIDVGDINNHLSVLEGLCRERNQKAVENAYQRGLDDVWECMKKIAFLEKPRDMRDFFGCSTLGGVLIDYSASEAIAKLKAYEEKQKADDEIKVGDEVEDHTDSLHKKAAVWSIKGDVLCVIAVGGGTWMLRKNNAVRTGRHFDIDKILEDMKE